MSEVEQLVRSLSLIMDNNDSARYAEIVMAAQSAVLADMGVPAPTVEDYRTAFRNGDTYDYQRVVGIAVADLLEEWLDELVMDEWWKAILTDVLDLGSWATRDALGEHYLPDPDDLEPDDDYGQHEEES